MLRIFGDQTGVDVQGLSWMTDGKAEFLRYSRLGSKVLCSTHNAGLSELDEAAARFIRRIVEVNQHLATHKRRRPIPPASFDGHLVERWMTKALCGLVVSGQAPSPAMEPRDWRPPPWWLDVIYDGAPMPDACGLYFPVRPPFLSSPRPNWTVGPFGQLGGSTYGLRATFMDKVLVLALEPPGYAEDSLLVGAAHRPTRIRDRNGINEALTDLTWHRPTGDGLTVNVAHPNPRRASVT